MLNLLFLAVSMMAQPSLADRPLPVVAELCNDTAARVAFAVVRPGSDATQVQRGWFTVEPYQCLEGAIGEGRGGQAFVHAYSGGYVWPSTSLGASFCTPARSHQRAALTPACDQDERELIYAPVRMGSRNTHHSLSYRVRCEDLPSEDASLCSVGLQGEDGFAERVRVLEVCNNTRRADRVAVAAPNLNQSSWRISEWTEAPAGACSVVWRGLAPDREIFVTSERGNNVGQGGDQARSFCFAPDRQAVQTQSGPDVSACATLDEHLTTFGKVQFSLNAGRFTAQLMD